MTNKTCFSGECGLCTGCSGKAGTKDVLYMTPQELCKDITGEDAPPPEVVKDTRKLYLDMLRISDEYRNSKPISHGKVCYSFDEHEQVLQGRRYTARDREKSCGVLEGLH